jgi:hypothetical protein
MRLVLAVASGLAAAVVGAVVLGDYPLSGLTPWVAAGLIPLLVGSVMSLVAGGPQRSLWVLTGPLSAASLGWGVRIATGWGLDPVPVSGWVAIGLALVWPLAWAARPSRPRRRSVNGQLGDLGHPGRAEVGDP